ncbi:MAG: hypothetical protein GF320_04155 [Armatimonadia bacterium]|nr:hypothetical protein [Armatimonadia bacterium]
MTLAVALHLALGMVTAAGQDSTGPARVVTYPAPEDEAPSPDYRVWIDGQPVFCYTSYRYDPRSDHTIAGRPVSPLTFAYFDFEGSVDVRVRLLPGLTEAGLDTRTVVVRPLAHDIEPTVEDDEIRFSLDEPCQLSIEPGGSLTHALHLFANPLEVDPPSPDDPGILYFGPGSHELGVTDIQSGQTVYVAGGAVLHLKPAPEGDLSPWPGLLYGLQLWEQPGMFTSSYQRDVTIRGRGILCGRRALDQLQRGHLIRVQEIEDLSIEGIIIRESSVWSLNVVNSRGVHIDNVKIVGHYVNNDGIVVGGTSDALVENCFSHNADDSLEIKVWVPQSNVTFRNCVVWNDVGGAFGLCHETDADLSNVIFEGCTAIHVTDSPTSRGAIGLELQGPGNVSNFRFENIVIEDVRGESHAPIKVVNNWDGWHMNLPTVPQNPYKQSDPPPREQPRGSITGVVFRNINVIHSETPHVVVMADGPDSPVRDIVFENVTVNGRALAADDPRLVIGDWVTGLVIR